MNILWGGHGAESPQQVHDIKDIIMLRHLRQRLQWQFGNAFAFQWHFHVDTQPRP